MTGLICLLLTFGIYMTTKRIYNRYNKVYLSPLIITPLIIIVGLMLMGISYENYNSGGKWLTTLLQPATVAFAVPLYKNYKVLKKHAYEILVSVLAGSCIGMLSSVFLAQRFHLNSTLVTSLVPRSVTTPIAMNVSEIIGGVPNMTAVFVIITGLLGSIIGPIVLKMFKIDTEIARGILYGTSSHGMGTSKAFEGSVMAGSISSISMILAALFTLGAAPLMMMIMFH